MSKYLFYFASICLIATGLLAIYERETSTQQGSDSLAGATALPITRQVAIGTATPVANRDQANFDFIEWVLDGMRSGNSGNSGTTKLTAKDHLDLGYTLLTRDKNYSEAINEFTLALTLDPYNVDATYFRGYTYVLGGRVDLGMSDYNRAIQLDPGYADVYNSRGNVYRLYRYDYTRAIADYKQAIKLDPGHVQAYNNLGMAYYDTSDYDFAITAFDKAIEVSPTFAWAYNNRGLTHSDMDQSDLAIKDFTRAIELSPKYAEAYRNRAWEYEYMKNSTAAIADFKMVLKVSDDANLRKEAEKEIQALEGN